MNNMLNLGETPNQVNKSKSMVVKTKIASHYKPSNGSAKHKEEKMADLNSIKELEDDDGSLMGDDRV